MNIEPFAGLYKIQMRVSDGALVAETGQNVESVFFLFFFLVIYKPNIILSFVLFALNCEPENHLLSLIKFCVLICK